MHLFHVGLYRLFECRKISSNLNLINLFTFSANMQLNIIDLHRLLKIDQSLVQLDDDDKPHTNVHNVYLIIIQELE